MRAGKIIFNEKKNLLIAWFFACIFTGFFSPSSTSLNFELAQSLYIKSLFMK
jgi:hypothetical protein